MTRALKFRAWDTALKYWIEEADYLVCSCGNIALRDSGSREYNCIKADRFVITQFTGLFDKNGEEIYEGDVVKKTHWFKPVHGVSLQASRRIATIEWSLSSTRLGFNIGANRKGKTEYEIIGNIYENPELLSV